VHVQRNAAASLASSVTSKYCVAIDANDIVYMSLLEVCLGDDSNRGAGALQVHLQLTDSARLGQRRGIKDVQCRRYGHNVQRWYRSGTTMRRLRTDRSEDGRTRQRLVAQFVFICCKSPSSNHYRNFTAKLHC
jgi:hypothetical protein